MNNFDLRFLGMPNAQNMLTAQPNMMPVNMLMIGQTPQPAIDMTATGAIPSKETIPKGGIMAALENQTSAPVASGANDAGYYPPAPDANRAPITQQDYQASLSHLQSPQAAQQQAPSPAQSSSQSGGLDMGTAAAFLQGLGRGNGLLSAIGGGMAAVQEQKQGNQTVNLLMARGVPEAEAQIVARNPQAAIQVLQNLQKGADPKSILELQKLGYEVDAARLKAQGGGASNIEYGKTPIWGQDAQGNPVIGVLGTDGSFKKVDTGGFDISSGTEQIDLGDSFAIKDKRSGQIIGSVPKNLANAEKEKVVGKAQGEAFTSLPSDLARGEQTIADIDTLLSHDGLSAIVGPADQYRPNWTMGASGRDALTYLKKLQGGAFLQAFGMLKGGGAITEIEGAKAEAAMARMDRSLSEDDFKTALKDFRNAVSDGMQKLKQKAGGNSAPSESAQSSSAPQTGMIEDGYRFKGGNPSDPNSWEKVQ
ncbi:hypothetical protein [Ochrobactrum sp. SFR4]|uniref:hypothetical protein n=1 Tax=Ochrobactrum sp. SFR4 TaxID=2717368 RepID=UPI001C8C4872|nr:hypothetical protein [Ochrobactrum sp. SFR4]MBX8827445.1 hypothetical protein [Ochrobactrum sp. SFR4]